MSRPLGLIEQYTYYRDVNHCYTNIVAVAEYTPKLTPKLVFSAIKGLLTKECGFCLNTFNGGQSIKPLRRIRFEDCVEFRDVEEFDVAAEISALHDICFPVDSDTLPLWKLVIFNERYAAFVTDHTICDGTALVNFQQLLLDELNMGAEEEVGEYVYELKGEPKVPGPLEQYVDIKPALGYKLKIILQELGPAFISNFVKTKRFGQYELKGQTLPVKVGLTPSIDTKVALLSLSAEQLKLLREKSKAHGLRLTSMLMYYAAKAMENVAIPENEQKAQYDLSVRIPINARKSAEPALTFQTGTLATAQELCIPSAPLQKAATDWKYIKTIQDELDRSMEAKEPQQMIGLLKLVGAENRVKQMKRSAAFSGTAVEVSNVGYFPLQGKSFQIKDIWFSQCAGFTGGYVNLNVIGFPGGLRVTLSYDTKMPYGDRVEGMAKEIERLIETEI